MMPSNMGMFEKKNTVKKCNITYVISPVLYRNKTKWTDFMGKPSMKRQEKQM